MTHIAVFFVGLIVGAGIVLGLAALFHHCDIDPLPTNQDSDFL